MKIQHVPIAWVNKTWPLVEPYLQKAVELSSPDYTIEQVKTYVASDQWLLVVAADENGIHGAATVLFMNRPDDRVAMITYIGGRLISSPDTFEQFKQVLRGFGATAIEGAAREAIARLWTRYGFTEKHRVVGVKI